MKAFFKLNNSILDFDTEFRKFLEDLLGAFRKFLEQARISSKDQNYIILVNETVGKIDKALKIVNY